MDNKKITVGGYTILVSELAGFCFGVSRAIDIVTDLLDKGVKVATLGPIIHNPSMVTSLQQRGCRVVNDISEDGCIDSNETLVIRSHGVAPFVYDKITKDGINMVDATCPYVKKIHDIVSTRSNKDSIVLIAGDANHPEIVGIIGHCNSDVKCFTTVKELGEICDELSNNQQKNIVLVAQTTFNKKIWEESINFIKNHCTNIQIFDTICSATSLRQSMAVEIAKQCDLMVVLGGKDSSNTKKLWQICSAICRSIWIETAEDLELSTFSGSRRIGVTAGASTPAYIIKEAVNKMEEILTQEIGEEMDFAQLLEQSLETEKLYMGKRVKGIVTTVATNEIHVDINAKQAGIVHIDELTDDPSLKIDDIVSKGDEIDLVVLKVNDQEGIVMLSKKRCDAQAGFEKIKEAYEANAILDGVITDVVRGGVLVFTNNTKVFVPASQVSLSRVDKLETLLKQPVKIKILEVNEKRGRALASVKAVLNEERKALSQQFWDEAEVGKIYTGEVKSLTQYGAFVDLGGVDGMIHITELAWTRIKHPSEVVKVGQTVEVYIKDLDTEKKRISLGYKKTEDNPWEIFAGKYNVGDEVEATIVSFTAYGAFARIIPGIDGLIHISQIANQRVEKISDILKIGQVVTAKIIDINLDDKRVSLSIRALLADEEPQQDGNAEGNELVYSDEQPVANDVEAE